MTEPRDYRSTVFLPKTDFPMKAGLPQKEPGILARWQEQDLYRTLRNARAGREKFILHDGPPYANGDMHIGHALNHILKDMVCRTQSLAGKDAPYVPGWDCHGLPIEWKVEEQYRKKKLDKDQVDPVEFRAECRAYAQNWVDTQREQLKRLGILGDWDNPYLTMDFQAEATIVAELLKFAESGQLYRGAKPVMWSPVEKTALAEAEVEYEDIVSTQVDVAFEIIDAPNAPELVGAYAVIWTTTPWTIPVNQAIAYGPEVEYEIIELWASQDSGSDLSYLDDPRLAFLGNNSGKIARFLVAAGLKSEFAERVSAMAETWYPGIGLRIGATSPFDHATVKGTALAGATARHPMARHFTPSPPSGGEGRTAQPDGERGAAGDTLANTAPGTNPLSPDPSPPEGGEGRMAEFFLRPRPFLPGSFVTTDSGTGLVHMAPDHGEDDFDLCKAHGIEPVFAVEADGKYRADWAWLGGQGSVINPKFNAPDGPICTALREAGGLVAASADYRHSYPHSWRSKAKVIYRCTPQWFVPMDRPIKPSPLQGRGLGEGDGPDTGVSISDGPLSPTLSPEGEREFTLRELAEAAIKQTRFVPEKGSNRIGAMVANRPDWVLSRQRAWGVPITLFVDRKTGQYLNDAAVNARIVAAVREGGVDAWSDANAPALLGPDRDPADYERVTDILDVWFDSGSTHAFVLESGRWPDLLRPDGWTGPRADLYLEGTDQHRGWFQSSLLESCATRGTAPYKAVLTHGFTMDAKGMKMSKSLGNTVNPLDLMRDYGADILRLWALSVDFTEDHRIGKEILAGVADQYRKLRNTLRYLLGALDGFAEAERVADVAAMPELERYMLALLAKLDGTLRQAVDDFDYNTYVRALADFCNEDLSAFFFDIRKDCLYCDAADDPKRMAYRTVLDTLFHALVRWLAPVLVFTAEEAWGTRFPEAGSVHLLEWPVVPPTTVDVNDLQEIITNPRARWHGKLEERWERFRRVRTQTTQKIEPYRRDKVIGSSLEAEVVVRTRDAGLAGWLETVDHDELAEVLIVSSVDTAVALDIDEPIDVSVTRTTHHKCGRCWRHLPEVTEDGALCGRCATVVGE